MLSNKTVLHLVPSGILRSNVLCMIGSGVVLYPKALREEVDGLNNQGINTKDRILISKNCSLILPSHILIDQFRESFLGKKKIGTTGRGIGPAYEDKVGRRSIRLVDLQNESLFEDINKTASKTFSKLVEESIL